MAENLLVIFLTVVIVFAVGGAFYAGPGWVRNSTFKFFNRRSLPIINKKIYEHGQSGQKPAVGREAITNNLVIFWMNEEYLVYVNVDAMGRIVQEFIRPNESVNIILLKTNPDSGVAVEFLIRFKDSTEIKFRFYENLRLPRSRFNWITFPFATVFGDRFILDSGR